MNRTELPRELVWQVDGHLADAAVVALADAQDVLPADACESCARRVGDAALTSLAAREGLAPAAARPIPWAAIGGAVALAAAGVAPLLVDLPHSLPRTTATLMRAAPILVRAGFAMTHGAGFSQAVVVVSVASLLVMALAALAVAGLASSGKVSNQGVVR
jgi:hypothetical protein